MATKTKLPRHAAGRQKLGLPKCPPNCVWCRTSIPIQVPIPSRETTAVLGLQTGAPVYVDKEVPSTTDEPIDVEKLIDFCRRNLAAPAWLPLAVQKQLFAALEKERADSSGLRYRLTAEVAALRDSLREERAAHQHTKNLFASMSRRAADAERKLVSFAPF